MTATIPASRIATLVDGFDRSPAYSGLADALRTAIGDGRVPTGARLPSERDLTEPLGVSRTTVTRAYALLTEQGYAAARRGAGTFARIPGGRSRARDRALHPDPLRALPRAAGVDDRGGMPDPRWDADLVCAAASAPVGVAEAYAGAAEELPAYLGGHGYFPTALPLLAELIAARYEAQGVPTAPEQIMVTSGALAATAVAAHASLRTGERAVVDDPVYPNAVQALRHAGARIVPARVQADGWDLDAYAATVRQSAARAAYLLVDFQNPTGNLMSDAQRERCAALLRDAHVRPIVDEAHRDLVLDEHIAMPAPFAAHSAEAITVGSASKSVWGGLRMGWMRLPVDVGRAALSARLGLELGAPVFEQLVLARLLQDGAAQQAQRERLRRQRDHLVGLLRSELPDWEADVPHGGMVLWCRLPQGGASALALEAEADGVRLAAGPDFAPGGGHDDRVRLPWTLPEAEMDRAIPLVAAAWRRVLRARRRPARRASQPVVVA